MPEYAKSIYVVRRNENGRYMVHLYTGSMAHLVEKQQPGDYVFTAKKDAMRSQKKLNTRGSEPY